MKNHTVRFMLPFVLTTALVFGFVLPLAAQELSQTSDSSYILSQIEGFKKNLKQIAETEGTGTLTRYLEYAAVHNADVAPLRALVFSRNNGQPQEIVVEVGPGMQSMVEFANRQLRKSGIDFFVYTAHLDPNLTPATEPLPKDALKYHIWRTTRAIGVPLIGVATTLASSWHLIVSQGLGATLANTQEGAALSGSIAVAAAVAGLELQFGWFSNKWAKVWKKKLALVPEKAKLARFAYEDNFPKKIINKTVDEFNRVVHGVTEAHAYNLMVNYGYMIAVWAAAFTGQAINHALFGTAWPEFNLLKVVNDSGLTTLVYWFAFGLGQVSLGKLIDRGQMQETLRFQIETSGAFWNRIWNVLEMQAALPWAKVISKSMQLLFGSMVTIPLLLKIRALDTKTEKINKMLKENEGQHEKLSNEIMARGSFNFCEDFMGLDAKVSKEFIPFRRTQTLWPFLRESMRNTFAKMF